MSKDKQNENDHELTIDEVIDETLLYLDFPAETLTPERPDDTYCNLTPREHERARATIAYLGYRLLLMYRMKRSSAFRSAGGGVAMTHYSNEIRQEIATALGISGPTSVREDEVKRLYKIASKTEGEDEVYRKQIGGIMEGFMEDYNLDPSSLGIVFI